MDGASEPKTLTSRHSVDDLSVRSRPKRNRRGSHDSSRQGTPEGERGLFINFPGEEKAMGLPIPPPSPTGSDDEVKIKVGRVPLRKSELNGASTASILTTKKKKPEPVPEYRIKPRGPITKNVFMNQVLDSAEFKAETGVYTASRESLEARSIRGSMRNLRNDASDYYSIDTDLAE